jgi:DNA (cytosine-5)-methyltransferase 1
VRPSVFRPSFTKPFGFEAAAAVEIDPDAAASHGLNFHAGEPRHAEAGDTTTLSPEALTEDLGLGDTESAIDVLVGGPPCQAFARVGRSKLREIDAHPQAFKHDPRARLYLEYLRYVNSFKPLAILVENVPDVLNHGGQNIAEEICQVLEEKGYVALYTLLNAAFYGVPQMRERMFLIGYRRELGCDVAFPEPTHWVDLPPGYEGSRSVALKLTTPGSTILDGAPPLVAGLGECPVPRPGGHRGDLASPWLPVVLATALPLPTDRTS